MVNLFKHFEYQMIINSFSISKLCPMQKSLIIGKEIMKTIKLDQGGFSHAQVPCGVEDEVRWGVRIVSSEVCAPLHP